ncbi:hypothetical protein C8J56DRAFT_243796 [Mycena floridula]|nr:hypothetical protein C8J56DRAFT_243796 [Mycena floridula]
MRFSAVILFVATVSAAQLPGLFQRATLPDCANLCIAKADFDGCNPVDNLCLCKSQKFVSSSTNCIKATCTGSDLTEAISGAIELCASVGVTLTSSSPAASQTQTGSAAPDNGAPTTTGAGPAATSNAAVVHSAQALTGLAAIAGIIGFAL